MSSVVFLRSEVVNSCRIKHVFASSGQVVFNETSLVITNETGPTWLALDIAS